MKKSWHPLLLKNQERVWLEEKKAVCLTRSAAQTLTDDFVHSSRRRRSWISFVRRRKRSGNCRSYNDCKRNRRERNGRRN